MHHQISMSKLREFDGGDPEKILRFCKALSIIFIIENVAGKGGGSRVMSNVRGTELYSCIENEKRLEFTVSKTEDCNI